MNVSRATFLRVVCLAAFGARVDARVCLGSASARSEAAAGAAATDASRRLEPFRLHAAVAAHFRPHLNTPFAIHTAGGGHARFVLVKVIERPVTKDVEQFSLIFHAPAGTAVPDGMHAVRHLALGAFDLFIVPINARDGRRTIYEASFSRHRRT